MRFAQVDAEYYCGIDLHFRTMFATVMDKQGEILFRRNMPNDFETFNNYMQPFLPNLAVGVESSCYYYWLADGCCQANLPFYLGHAYYMKAIHGGKAKSDPIDSRTSGTQNSSSSKTNKPENNYSRSKGPSGLVPSIPRNMVRQPLSGFAGWDGGSSSRQINGVWRALPPSIHNNVTFGFKTALPRSRA
ncbi:MAG: transposase [bacterium]